MEKAMDSFEKWLAINKASYGITDSELAKWFGVTNSAIGQRKKSIAKWNGADLQYLFKKFHTSDEEILAIMKGTYK